MNEIKVQVTVEEVIATIKDSWELDDDVEISPHTPLREIDGEIREPAYMLDIAEKLNLDKYVEAHDEDRINREGKKVLASISAKRTKQGDYEGASRLVKASNSTLDFCNAVNPQDLADICNYD